MSSITIQVDDNIMDYLLKNVRPESAVATELREATELMPMAVMQISPLQGAFMSWLVELLCAENTIEVGTFTGYSALCVAEALPSNGKVIACDVSEPWTNVAKEYWAKAGLAEKIELHLRPAVDTLDELLANGHAGTFDFAFIDADKTNYDTYYERCLTLVRKGGIVAIDNVLWSGSVADQSIKDESTNAIRTLNEKIANDERVNSVMLPIGDGLTLATKR